MIKNERNFLNYLSTPDNWELSGEYEVPTLPKLNIKDTFNLQLMEFHEAHNVSKSNRKDKTIHFFLSDYLFERTWSKYKQTADFLKQFKCVLSPDFSQYTDMPKAMKVWNHYRKMWVSRYWIDRGIRVIPVAGWSDEESFEYCFDGMPKDSLIAVSSVGIHRDSEATYLFEKGYNKMLEILEPRKVLFYGKPFDFVEGNVIYAKHARNQRFKALKQIKEAQKSLDVPIAKSELLEESNE